MVSDPSNDPDFSRPADADWLRPEECETGFVYAIYSRNLSFGVFRNDGADGFVGIREKFNDLFLFTEYHYDTGGHFGTVRPYLKLEKCPIENLEENLGSRCKLHGRPTEFRVLDTNNRTGWWFHSDDGTALPRYTERVEGEPFDTTFSPMNKPLFDYLTDVEARYSWKDIMNQTRLKNRPNLHY